MMRQCKFLARPGVSTALNQKIYCSLYYRIKCESVKDCRRKEVMPLENGTEQG